MTTIKDILAENIRPIDKLNDDDLRASMKAAGWHKHLPGIKDENGAIIVGHRRDKIATEEGIKPTWQTVTFGTGAKADFERMQLASASNTGAATLTKADRKRLAERLYDGGKGMVMQEIADMLCVTKKTISLDLSVIVTRGNNQKPAKTARNPKGAGRPKGRPRAKQTDTVRDQIIALTEQGKSSTEIAAQVGVQPRAVRHLQEDERIRQQAEPTINRVDLSMSAQQKLDAAIRQHERKLTQEFEKKHSDRFYAAINEYLPELKAREKKANQILERHKGIMPKAVYMKIVKALHSDRRKSVTDKELDDALIALKSYQHVLIAPDAPLPDLGIPKNYTDWEALKKKKAPRKGSNNVSTR